MNTSLLLVQVSTENFISQNCNVLTEFSTTSVITFPLEKQNEAQEHSAQRPFSLCKRAKEK